MTERKPKSRQYQMNASIFRLNISYLSENKFGKFPILGKDVKREPNLCPLLEGLKAEVLELLWKHERHRGLVHYKISWQTHQSNGLAHLDILLKYQKNIKKSRSSFNYLLAICPQDLGYFSQRQGQISQVNITAYANSRVNQAILDYGEKEDPQSLDNFKPEDSSRIVALAAIRRDPFRYFEQIMDMDPYNFELSYYVKKYSLASEIRGWSSIKSKLNDIQAAARALSEQAKPGIRHIDRDLIEERLSPEQLAVYDGYPCFRTIVDILNQIPRYRYDRPHKTLNLYIYGPRGIGKTSFINEGPTNLASLVPHYDINLQNRYLNRYYNHVYGFISWNEFKYTDFSPTWILKLLEGLDLQIPIRYASNVKRDNPLVIATSNISFTQQIERRFKDQPAFVALAKSNLLNERIVEVMVPVPMFFMQKLLVPNR